MGHENIGQTSNESSNSGNFISHSPFYDEHDLVLENILCSLKEHMMRDNLFIREGTKLEFETHIPIISRDAFHFLNSSTYTSLYRDICYHHAMQSCVPNHFGMNPTLYNQVQINGDFHT